MRKIVTLMCCLLALIGFSECNNENEYPIQNEQESNLTLTAPNGMRIASSLHSLKEETAVIIAKQVGDDLNFTITDIQYTPVDEGYLALISYKLENGQQGNYAKTNSTEVIDHSPTDMVIFDFQDDMDWKLNEEKTMLYTTTRTLSKAPVTTYICKSASECKPCQVKIAQIIDSSTGETSIKVSCDNNKCKDCKLTARLH